MALFDSCFGSYDPASVIAASLPPGPGAAREQAAFDLAQAGSVPYFNRQWIKVPVSADGVTGDIFVTPDYFSLGTDADFLRMPLAAETAERIGALIGGRLPTRKMVRDIHAAAAQKLVAEPWGPPYDASMMSTQRFVDHNAVISRQFAGKGYSLGRLTSGHKKDVVVSPAMDREHVCIFGWFRDSSPTSAIQGPAPNCSSHGKDYADYSHGIRFVKNTMIADGKDVPVDEALRHPKLHRLVSDEGPFAGSTTYTDQVPSGSKPQDLAKLVVGVVFAGLGFLGTRTIQG